MNTVWPASEYHKNTSHKMNNVETRVCESTRVPNNGGVERDNAALIVRSLEQKEKVINAVIISAGAICGSLTWTIVRTTQNLQQARAVQRYRDLYAEILSHVPLTIPLTSPQRIAVPPVPHAPGLLRENAYWLTSLVFGLSAISIAVLVKQKIRGHRLILQRNGRPSGKARVQEPMDGDVEAWFMSVATETMYRLFQVSLVVFLLGHVNTFLCPVGATTLIPTVICGLLYVFGTLGPTVSSEEPFSPSPG